MVRNSLRAAMALTLLGCATSIFAIPVPPPPEETASDIRIADSDVYPESLSADAAGRLYIGSLKGIVFRATPGAATAEAWIRPNAENGLLGILGVLVDEKAGTLWLCSAPAPFRNPPAVGISSLKAFDLANGAFKASYPFPAPASACNDIAVASDGTVFATDTPNGRILTLKPGAKALALFAEDTKLRGIDGIAFAEDGTLYINNVATQKMMRIERKPDGAFGGLTELALSQPVSGPDGLRPIGGHSFLQAEGTAGQITKVNIEGDGATITVLRDGLQSSPGMTLVGGTIYALEGKIGYLVDPKLKGQDPGPFFVRAIPFDGQ